MCIRDRIYFILFNSPWAWTSKIMQDGHFEPWSLTLHWILNDPDFSLKDSDNWCLMIFTSSFSLPTPRQHHHPGRLFTHGALLQTGLPGWKTGMFWWTSWWTRSKDATSGSWPYYYVGARILQEQKASLLGARTLLGAELIFFWDGFSRPFCFFFHR